MKLDFGLYSFHIMVLIPYVKSALTARHYIKRDTLFIMLYVDNILPSKGAFNLESLYLEPRKGL